jgi:hypothetical protein
VPLLWAVQIGDGVRLAADDPGPWFTQASVWVSIGALVVALGSTIYAGRQTAVRDRYALRSELRQLVQRLVALPREILEIREKFPARAMELSTSIVAERTALAVQGAEVIGRIGRLASGMQCLVVAQALEESQAFERSLSVVEVGLRGRVDPLTQEALLRLQGKLLFLDGRFEPGRSALRQALTVWAGAPPDMRHNGYAITEWNWSSFARSAGHDDEADAHVEAARAHAREIDPTSRYGNIRRALLDEGE